MNWPEHWHVWHQLLAILLGSAAVMLLAWAWQRRSKDAGIGDVCWSACMGASAVFAAMTGEGDITRRWILGVLGGVWGARLALHLLFDRVLRGPEDGRYQMMRETFGVRIQGVFFAFFQAQALSVAVLALPFALASHDARPAQPVLDAFAVGLWVVGIAGETLADAQLARFKGDAAHKGKVCTVGLWRYSRHPNYFFEWLMWCAYALLALLAPWGFLGLASPIIILVLVLRFTGIPPTEARAIKSRGDAYREYQKTTSAFVPWFPKRGAVGSAGAGVGVRE